MGWKSQAFDGGTSSDNGEDAYVMWSEPISSPEFRNRISRLRSQLAARMNAAFYADTPPAHFTDRPKLQ